MNPVELDEPGKRLRVGGVVWDPDYPLDFSMSAAPACLMTDPATGILSGFGLVTMLNGTPPSIFCPGGELTFKFAGFLPIGASPGCGCMSYTGGRVDFFSDAGTSAGGPGDPLAMNADAIGRGTPWLSLAGSEFNRSTLRAMANSVLPPNLACLGQLVVVDGIAAPYFATHTQPGGADLAFSGSFTQPLPGGGNGVFGTANFFGQTGPEPAR